MYTNFAFYPVIPTTTKSHIHFLNQLLLFSHKALSNSLQSHGVQHSRLLCPTLSPRVCSNICPLSWWCHPTISPCHAFLLLPSIFHSISVFSCELALCNRWPKHWSWSFSFIISPSSEYSGLISFNIDWSPCSPRDSQESSPAPQLENTNSLALILLYGQTLTSVGFPRWH